jgi:hypothetical protein
MEALNAYQIRRAMRQNKNFLGVFAADALPLKKHGGIIVNTDASHLPGTHWVAMFVDKQGKCEYFDSYGLPPMVQEHIDYLQKCKYNNTTLQSLTSVLCGHYCMLYLDSKFRGLSMNQFLKQMKKENQDSNDAFAFIRFRKRFGVLPKCRQMAQVCRCRV